MNAKQSAQYPIMAIVVSAIMIGATYIPAVSAFSTSQNTSPGTQYVAVHNSPITLTYCNDGNTDVLSNGALVIDLVTSHYYLAKQPSTIAPNTCVSWDQSDFFPGLTFVAGRNYVFAVFTYEKPVLYKFFTA